MFRAALGRGERLDAADAARMAARRCRARLEDAPPLVGIVFAAATFDHAAMLREIRTAFPGMPLAGCSSDGQIASGSGLSDDAVDLLVLAGEGPRVGAGAGTDASRDPASAAEAAVESARAALGGKPALALAFSDGLRADTDALMAELARRLGPECPVFGGAAAREDISAGETWQFLDDRVLTGGLGLVLLGGNIRYAYGISNSWTPIGPEARVEETRGRDVLRIGGRRALDFYRYYLGPHSEPAIELPLAIYETDAADGFYIRGPVAFDEESGAVSLTGAVPAGCRIRLTEATRAGILADTRNAAREVVADFPSDADPAVALLFSCANRRRILGTRTGEELIAVEEALPAGLPAIGFHTYGEFAPLAGDGISRVHNCTLVPLILGAPRTPGEERAPLPLPGDVPEDESGDLLGRLERRYRFLNVRLARSERERDRLESLKEANTALLRRVNDEVNEARREIERQNRVLRQALSLAQEVQQSLLPRHPPRVPGFDIAGRVRYHSQTGGDYFDFLQSADAPGSFGVVVGDVSGHGVAAALLMTAARALLRSRADRPGPIADIVTDINRLLTRDISDSGRFMTLFFLHLDVGGRWLRWVRAGHDPALLIDPAGAAGEEVFRLGGSGMALGVDRNWVYAENGRPGLAPGQFLLMGTDGLWEARNPAGEMFGRERVIQAVRASACLDAEGVADRVFADLDAFLDGGAPEDDMTLVVLRRVSPANGLDPSAGAGI